MKKRVLSLLLAVALLMSLVPVLGVPASAAGSFVKATSLSVGDKVVFVCENASTELYRFAGSSTKYGDGNPYSDAPGGIMVFEVCDGYLPGSYAFKNKDDKYLYWTSGNSLYLNKTLSEKSSWNVTFDSSGNATILNRSDTARQIWWNVNSPRFACYTGKTSTTKGYYTVQIYKAKGTVCEHSDLRYEYPTPPTCTEDGVVTNICNNCGVRWNDVADAMGHDFIFKSDDKVTVYEYCNNCGVKQNVTINTLTEATAAMGTSTVQNVKGIVTYIKNSTIYIEDQTQGMCVYFSDKAMASNLKLGDEIFVSSKVVEYYNLPEMKPTSYLKLSTGNALPNTTTLTIGDVVASTSEDIPEEEQIISMEYVGKRVTFKDVSIGLVTSKGYTPLTDSEGNVIYIYASPELSSDIESGNKVDVTGVISLYQKEFQLLINPQTAETDVKKVGDGVPLIKQTVPISFAKACKSKGTYFQIEGIVTCMEARKIYLQDDTGGMVIYLASAPSTPPCAIGDKLRVFGLFANYNGVLELQYVDNTDPDCFKILSHGHKVVAQQVTIEELIIDSAIDYELFAEKVFLDDVTILEFDEKGNVLIGKDDYTILIYQPPTLNAGCVLDAVVDVTATVSGHNFDYQLVIVDADAVTFGSTCTHKDAVRVGDTAPTCTEPGYTGDLYCAVCGAFLEKGEQISPEHQDLELRNAKEPTCTTNGYSGDVYCSICGTFLEKGITVPASHKIITINDVEPTCDGEGYTGEQYCEVCGTVFAQGTTEPPLGHNYEVDIVYQNPTCTVPGSAEYKCDRCGDHYEGEIPATGHNSIYSDKGEVHSYICFTCGQSGDEEHNYEDGICTQCGAEGLHFEEIEIRHTLNLASDISINYVIPATALANYDMFYLECVREIYSGNESIGTESLILDNPVLKGNYYYFTLTGINATQMGDEISATLYMLRGDKIYCSNEDIYSVATYAYSQMNKDGSAESLRRLCADLLRYGKEAQVFKSYRLDSPVDAAMTEAHKSYLSDVETVTFGNTNTTLNDLQNPVIKWVGKSLNLESKVSVKYVFELGTYTGKVEDLSLRVHYINYEGKVSQVILNGAQLYDAPTNRYAFSFDGLLAAELRSVVDVAVYQGNTQLSQTLRYSPDTYGNGRTGQLLILCKALFAYSDTAKAFFGK